MDKLSAQYQELREPAAYYSFLKTVKGKGNVNIVLGIIGIVLGLIFTLMEPINVILVILGILLVGIGIWAKVKPTSTSLLFAGIGLCIMGAWNAVVTLLNIVAFIANPAIGTGWSPVAIVWAVVQISLGIDVFNRYRRFTTTPINRFDEQWLKKVEETIRPVTHADPNRENDVIEFRRQTVWTPSVWKGKLTKPYGIIASTSGDDVFIVTPDEVNVIDTGKFRKFRKASLIINGTTFNGVMPPESIIRLQYWKNPTRVVPV